MDFFFCLRTGRARFFYYAAFLYAFKNKKEMSGKNAFF